MSGGLLTPAHVMILLVIALLLYGPKRVPQTGRAIGRGIREFRGAITARDQSERTTLEPKPPSSDH